LVILGPLIRVAQDLVSLVDLLETLLATRVTRIDVGVTFAGEPAKGALDLFFAGISTYAEGLVIVLVFHILLDLVPMWRR
jgi:hypothetical protein